MKASIFARHLAVRVLGPLLLLSTGALAAADATSSDLAALGTPGEAKSTLSATELQGRRIFAQHCGVCHFHSAGGAALREGVDAPGPALYGELFKGNEAAFHEFISNGVPQQMPGFKYSLTSDEISSVIAYLETVPKPDPNAAKKPSGGGD